MGHCQRIDDCVGHALPRGTNCSTNFLLTSMMLTNAYSPLSPNAVNKSFFDVTKANVDIVYPEDATLPGAILTDFGKAMGIDTRTNYLRTTGIPQEFTNTAPAQISILIPGICVTKKCITNMSLGISNLLTFRGTVTNCSTNTTLRSVVVSNFANGVFTFVTNVASLAVNEGFAFTNTLLTTNPCLCETLWAWGTDELNLTVSNSVAAACAPKVTRRGTLAGCVAACR